MSQHSVEYFCTCLVGISLKNCCGNPNWSITHLEYCSIEQSKYLSWAVTTTSAYLLLISTFYIQMLLLTHNLLFLSCGHWIQHFAFRNVKRTLLMPKMMKLKGLVFFSEISRTSLDWHAVCVEPAKLWSHFVWHILPSFTTLQTEGTQVCSVQSQSCVQYLLHLFWKTLSSLSRIT